MKERDKNELFHRKLRLFLIPVLVVALVISSFAGVTAKADPAVGGDVIGSITVGSTTNQYYDLSALAKRLESAEGQTVTIEMATDWDASYGHDEFDVRLYIPENCKVTFNMHGHLFDRDNVWREDDTSNGELIYVETGATLTINGISEDSEKDKEHKEVRVFTGLEQETADKSYEDVAGHGGRGVMGACLAGGNSSAGTGGIYIDSGTDIVINDVTIAGCKANNDPIAPPWVHDGYGGGIIITESGTKLKLVNSSIFGCLAEDDGGAIYQTNDNNVSIELDNCLIDRNFANSDGGGINMDGEYLSITAKNDSMIINNQCEGYGGGVYFWNDDCTLAADEMFNLNIYGNSAEQGGGVYMMEEDCTLKNINIENNSASDKGSGVYINNDYTTIDNCTITDNYKHGVYVDSQCDKGMQIKGGTKINFNEGGDLVVANGSTHFNIDQNDEMYIGIDYVDKPDSADGYIVSENITVDVSDKFFANNDSYEVVYSYRDPEGTEDEYGRRLRYIKKSDESDDRGHPRVNPQIQKVETQDIHANSEDWRVYAGGYTEDEGGSGAQYEVRRIIAHHTSSGDKDYKTYYTDGFFFKDPIIYNNHLATASYGLATTGAYLDDYDYDYKHAGARQFMADIGCPDQMIYVNDSNMSQPGTDTIGCTIGSKVLQEYDGDELKDTDYTLIAIAVRGANYEKEWTSNVTLGDGSERDGEALGFSQAADQVMDAVDYYIHTYGLQEQIQNGKVKFWIAGFSRAGAASNLTAKRLIETYCEETDVTVSTGNEVFAYPCEAPKGGTDNAEKLSDKTKYYCIHNLVNTGDVVPLVGPEEMGFKRYGVDHNIPGSYVNTTANTTREDYISLVTTSTVTPKRASEASQVTTVTKYVDNSYLSTKKEKDSSSKDSYKEYVVRRDHMVKHLAAVDHTRLFNDYFYPNATGSGMPPWGKIGDFDGAKLEDYLPNFIAFLQQEACYNRYNYAVQPDVGDWPLQDFAREFFSGDEIKDIIKVLSGSISKLFTDVMADATIYMVLGNYYEYTPDEKLGIGVYFWDAMETAGCFDDLTDSQVDTLSKYWFTLADTIFNFADGDWDLGDDGQGDPTFPTGTQWINGSYGLLKSSGESESNGEVNTLGWGNFIYALTLLNNMDMIINVNHDMEVAIAWTRTYDSYYSKDPTTGEIKGSEYSEYTARWVTDTTANDYSVKAPGAFIKNSDPAAEDSYEQLEATPDGEEPKYNKVPQDQKILLEVGKIHDSASPAGITQGTDGDYFGEAIYYDIYDISDGDEGQDPVLSNQLYRGGVNLFEIQSVGNTFKIVAKGRSLGKFSDPATFYITTGHKVTVDDGSGNEPVVKYYTAGDDVTIVAKPVDNMYFTNWTAELLDQNGNTVEKDIAASLLGGKEHVSYSALRFTMPEEGAAYAEGKTYPEGYALKITAECKYRVRIVAPRSNQEDASLVPVVGEDKKLAGTAKMYFETEIDHWTEEEPYKISWSYQYQDKEYPAAGGDPIYGECVYTALIHVPKNEEKGILFTPDVQVVDTLELDGKWDKYTLKLDNTDGSVLVTIVFKPTGEGPEPPAAENKLQFTGVDVFDQTTTDLGDFGYVAQGQEVEVTAKTWEHHKFRGWIFEDPYHDAFVKPAEGQDLTAKTIKIKIEEGIPTDYGDLHIYALYEPVISEIDAGVDVPSGGHKMQMVPDDAAGSETLKIYLKDTWYVIHPDYINTLDNGKGSISWSPDPILGPDGPTADYRTIYTTSLRIVPREDENGPYIMAKEILTDDYFRMPAEFAFSEATVATMNKTELAAFDTKTYTLSYTFPLTTYKLKKIYPVEDVTGIPYGTAGDALKPYLPLIRIQLDNGETMTTVAAWGEPVKDLDSRDEYSLHVWTANGVVQLPYGVENPDNISLDVLGKLIVNGAESVRKAVPSVEPGDYIYDQSLTLSSETEGAAIYWTVDPDATDDMTQITSDPKWTAYEGLMIPINRANATEDEIGPDGQPTGRKQITLRTAAFKDGMRPDGVRTYTYVFLNEVKIPEKYNRLYTGKPEIGVIGGDFYTLEAVSAGVTISKDGDAVATEPGTYVVKAKIQDGFRWEITDPETGEVSYTTDDQILSFAITDTYLTEIAAAVEAPVGGAEMQLLPDDAAGKETLKIKLRNEWYVVHPDYINTKDGKGSIIWTPAPSEGGKAEYRTSYSASLKIVPKQDADFNTYIEVRKEGTTEYEKRSAEFLYADDLKTTMNGQSASFDKKSNTLSYTFPMTEYTLKEVYPPEDVTGIPYGTEGEALKTYLPLIRIKLDDGSVVETIAAWSDPVKNLDSQDEYSMHLWTAKGVVQLPYGVENPENLSLDVLAKLYVDPAAPVGKPIPSVDPGTYMEDQKVTLSSSTEGSSIYWTTDPGATDDMKKIEKGAEGWNLYDGQIIPVNRADAAEDEIGPDGKPTGRKMIRLRVAAFKDGMRPDGVRAYAYVFLNEVEVPAGFDRIYNGTARIGVIGSSFYTLTPVSTGVTINEDGSAAATEPGTYQVSAKIKDGFRWEITDPVTGEVTYTTEDQTIRFAVTARYITDMAAAVEAPLGGQPMQLVPYDADGRETLKIRFDGDDAWYVVHPDYIDTSGGMGSITWSPAAPEDGKAAYLETYTASLQIVPKTEGEISYFEVRKEGDKAYTRRSVEYLYAEDLTATMNNETAAFDAAAHTLSYTFPKTKYNLEKVYPPEDVKWIPYGTEGELLRTYLPLVRILLSDGRTLETAAAWDDPVRDLDSLDEYHMHVWTANGIVQLPEEVENRDDLPLNVIGKLYVDPAQSAGRAAPSVSPGTYLNDMTVTLSGAAPGAVIYWTTDPSATGDLNKVETDPKWSRYDGLAIALDRKDATEDEIGPDGKPTGRKLIRLRVASFKDGMSPDEIRAYTYVFVNEVKVPESYNRLYDGTPRIGVIGSKYYTLVPESEGVIINAEGDAAATEPGTYKVRAKINDTFRWEITDPATGEVRYTTADQIIEFTVTPKMQYIITYDLNGGTLDGKTGTVTVSFEAGTVIKLPEPQREGYTFQYWEGSVYKAGEEYVVRADHTFTAQWAKNGPAPTGDQRNSLLWLVLALAGLTGGSLVMTFFVRRKNGRS